jgi:16S rRNA (cytidine1402-2'-O)-methyltransferase
MEQQHPGKLYLVATPIGNLSDISKRAATTLKNVAFIAAEDTRVTRKLLEHLKIKAPLMSYYEYNKQEAGDKILNRILSGEDCALVTDAGTPGISDPGEDMVRLCAESGVTMVIIPGPCAAVSALSLSGLPAGRFTFEGFLPAVKKKRLIYLNNLKDEKRTMVFYEAPHKIKRTLADMLDVFGDRRLSISRELTKIYEETLRFNLSEAIIHFENKPPRGEFVLVIEGTKDSPAPDNRLNEAEELVIKLLHKGMSARDAVKKAAEETGCSRNVLYKAVTSRS